MHRTTFAGHPAELGEFEKSFKFWQHSHGANPFDKVIIIRARNTGL
jgi:hypothetical protein